MISPRRNHAKASAGLLLLQLFVPALAPAAPGQSPTQEPSADSSPTAQVHQQQPSQAATRTPHLLAVFFTSKQVAEGISTQLTVMLTRPAPAGGITVALQSSNPRVLLLPRRVTIPEGVSSLSLSLMPRGKAANTSVEVTASYENPGKDARLVTRKATLIIKPKS